MIFYKQFDLSLANSPKGIPFSPAFALNTLTFCNGTDRRWCSAIISTFPPICAILYCISAFYPFFAQRAVFSLISESEVSLHAVFPPHRIRRRRAGAQQAPVRENDPDPRAEAHSRPRGPAHDVEPRDEQHPPLRGQGQLRHDRPRHRRCAQHRAGPRLYLRPRHGDRRRRHGHRSEPEHQLLHPAFHVSAGQDRQPIPHHPGHPQRPGLRADLLQRCAQLRPSGPEQHRQHAAERRRPQLRRRRRGRHEHRVPHLPVRAVGGDRRRTGPAACGGLQLRRPPLCPGAESGHLHHLDGFRLYGGAQRSLLVQRRAPHPPLPR